MTAKKPEPESPFCHTEAREEFWKGMTMNTNQGRDNQAGGGLLGPEWTACIGRCGWWGIFLLTAQAAASVSLGKLYEESGSVAVFTAVSAPVFLVFLLLDGIGMHLSMKHAGWKLCRAWYSVLFATSLLMLSLHPG